MKIFVTGASGFLGRDLISKVKNDHEVTTPEHRLENISEWEKELEGMDVVLHLAGITHSKDLKLYEKINALGTKDLVLAAQKFGVKQFIYISTRALGENCGAYGNSKKLAEEFLKNSGLHYTIFRVAEAYDNSFGGGEGLSSLVNLIKKSFFVPFISTPDITLSPIHKDDVEKAIIASINNPTTYDKTYVLAGPENLTFREVVGRIAKYFKLKRVFIPMPAYFIKFVAKTPDQFQRLLCKKESLSRNVTEDIKVYPRNFLS